MKTWQIILVAAFGLIFLVMLVIFICFIIGLLILNFIMLNLDTVLTNQPARMAFTSAQALADARIRDQAQQSKVVRGLSPISPQVSSEGHEAALIPHDWELSI
ncbi:hypothetical protein F4824DRAFT_496890 [Ustulina deusta]|nr:hypothetical protein F4824DRAFT_496890 [Ustulina deusta]